jgi:hypothetical protein
MSHILKLNVAYTKPNWGSGFESKFGGKAESRFVYCEYGIRNPGYFKYCVADRVQDHFIVQYRVLYYPTSGRFIGPPCPGSASERDYTPFSGEWEVQL